MCVIRFYGNIIQSASRVFEEQVEFSSTAVKSKEWGGYPLITFPEVPDIDVLMMPRQDEPPLGVGEFASVPSAAAICNAVFDAILRGGQHVRPHDAAPQPPAANDRWRSPGCAASGRRPRRCVGAVGVQPAAMADDRADRAARPVRRIQLPPSPADNSSPHLATARSATPSAELSPTWWLVRRSTPPTSRPMVPELARGPTLRSARCARGFTATEGISIRRFHTHFAKTSDA